MYNKILQLLSTSPKERLLVMQGRKDKMLALWAFEKEFSKTLQEALINENAQDDYGPASQYFISTTITDLIKKPSDLVSAIIEFRRKNIAHQFLQQYMRHDKVSEAILLGLAADKGIFKKLPAGIGWTEVPIITWAKMYLKNDSGLLDVDQLLPLGIDANKSTSEYILSWAFEDKRLTPAATEIFKERFPKKYEHLNLIMKNR